MKQCHCSHKGMDIGISCVVIHFHVCKKFFQVLALMSSVHHPVVPSENLLPLPLSCLSILECCLDPGHSTSVKVQDGWLVYSPMVIPRQLRFSLYSGAVITESLM